MELPDRLYPIDQWKLRQSSNPATQLGNKCNFPKSWKQTIIRIIIGLQSVLCHKKLGIERIPNHEYWKFEFWCWKMCFSSVLFNGPENLHYNFFSFLLRLKVKPGITAVWCKGLSELSCAILESFNILCNFWSKIIHLRKSGLHIDIVVESMYRKVAMVNEMLGQPLR